MPRSITYSDPKFALAGEKKTWAFIYTPGNDLPKGASLKFDMGSKGREFDWEIPQVNLKSKKNLIWMQVEDKKSLPAKEILTKQSKIPQFEFTLPVDVKSGEPIMIFIGSPEVDKKKGNRSQTNTLRRRPFYLHIDPKGKGDYKETEAFHIDVRGNHLEMIRIITPSIVTKNQRFDVIVRFEDAYGNLTGHAPEETLIEFSYEKLRDNINWKLFVPETGFINLPNLYFNEPGIYRIQLKNLMTNKVFFSPPIKCFSENKNHLFWGLLHGESILWNATDDVESCLRYQRDEATMQFFASSPFESHQEITSDQWKAISSHISEFNEDERFITFLGMQWTGIPDSEGLRHIIYTKDNKSFLKRKESKANSLKKIYKSHTPKDFISIPSFTMGNTTIFDFKEFAPEYEKVVEIYNAWGSSECTKTEGNPRPILSKSKKGIHEKAEGSIRKALNQNCRFGFVAGGLDDRGIYASLFETDQVQYSPGLTAILAANQTRDSLIQALSKRSCYATTGPRIIIGFHVAKEPMGTILNTTSKPGLLFNRHLSGYIVGTDEIKEVLIIRNGKPFKTLSPKETTFEFSIDDSELLDKISLKPSSKEAFPFTYYYLRIMQKNGHLGWCSPIWVDLTPPNQPPEKKNKG